MIVYFDADDVKRRFSRKIEYKQDPKDVLAGNIKRLRMKRGLTQRELADSLYLSSQAVSKWENRQAAPDIFMLPKLANLLGCRIDDLFHNYD